MTRGRREDAAPRERREQILEERTDDIDALLADYGVPRVETHRVR